jgi:hypothetical protein
VASELDMGAGLFGESSATAMGAQQQAFGAGQQIPTNSPAQVLNIFSQVSPANVPNEVSNMAQQVHRQPADQMHLRGGHLEMAPPNMHHAQYQNQGPPAPQDLNELWFDGLIPPPSSMPLSNMPPGNASGHYGNVFHGNGHNGNGCS